MSFKRNEKQKKLQNLEGLLSELVSSEQVYIDNLAIAVDGFLAEFRKKEPYVPVPEDLKDHKGLFVFANIEEIYRWHKEFFLQALVKNRHCPSDMGKAFVSCESQFHMYAKYCSNKNISEYITGEYSAYFNSVRKRLGQKLELSCFLIKPIQRLAQYKLLLSQIAEHLKALDRDWESMKEAQTVIETVLKSVNDFTSLQGIKNYNGDISDHGKLIFHEMLVCKYDNKKIRHHVFLFKRLLMFTDKYDSKGKFGTATYNYRLQIPMNKLQLKELPNKRFMLKSNDPVLQDRTVVCYSEDEQLHCEWLQHIKTQLRMQADLIADLVNPTSCGEIEVLM